MTPCAKAAGGSAGLCSTLRGMAPSLTSLRICPTSFVSLWGHFGVTLVSLWGHFAVTLGTLWGHVGVTLNPNPTLISTLKAPIHE
eukprot:10413548-Heterocapsa_arctica.AAC.1